MSSTTAQTAWQPAVTLEPGLPDVLAPIEQDVISGQLELPLDTLDGDEQE